MVGISTQLQVHTIDWHSPEIEVWRAWSSQTQVSPFQTPTYLKLFADHFLTGQAILLLCIKKDGLPLAFGGFVLAGGVATALGMQLVDGGQEISDFFDLVFRPGSTANEVKQVWEAVSTWLHHQEVETLQLDYLSSTSISYQVLQTAQTPQLIASKPQEVAPAVTLPVDWMLYVSSLKKKYRDELKRKLKRLDQVQPEYQFGVVPTDQATADFIRLHRLSDSAKQHFMTDSMAAFFTQLALATHDGGWQWHYAFVALAGVRVAAVAYFQRSTDAFLLYNSGYDPAYRQQGVGFCLVARLLQSAIEQHCARFDFLRGSERYKYELGGVDQELYQLRLLVS